MNEQNSSDGHREADGARQTNAPAPVSASAIALTSAKQMRALAHPLRMSVLGELRINGPRTVGGLSEVFDEAPGTLSYHLGKLAEFGFVEEVPELAADRRERWWRAAHQFTNIAPDPNAPPAERQALSVVRHQVIDGYASTLHRAVEAESTLPKEWAQPSGSSDIAAFLTREEFAEAGEELQAVLQKWYDRSDKNRDGAEAVQLITHAVRMP
ncbi:winged helix-turn-helix domain-containing protein [Glaciibacter superstes]|uniref:winged helix-turn-helix domain-containing protein n=1 Tax=Glaciibacter superstes TaxID=501023 RepID=UPI0003B7616C|nr:helix-turn-helix domain-containing protein [Glaciibacter superstes]